MRIYKRIASISLALLLFFTPTCVAAWLLFGTYFDTPVLYLTGAHPLDIAIGDINNDGDLDVLTANRDGMSFSVFLGNGDGSLTEVDTINIDHGPTSLSLGDINKDGRLDIAATVCSRGCNDNAIMIFHGLGNGQFEQEKYLASDGVPYNIALSDLNGDEFLDIIASDYPSGNIHVLESEQDNLSYKEFGLAAGLKTIALLPIDLNRDGSPDLIASNHGSASASIFINGGNGEFDKSTILEVGPLPYSIASGDVNQDGNPDLLVAHSSDPGKVSIYEGTQKGKFKFLSSFDVEDRLAYIDTADFNGDGRLDIIVTRHEKQFASLFLNEGRGRFSPREIRIPARNKIYSLGVCDLNHDPYPDLLTVDYEANSLSVRLGIDPVEYDNASNNDPLAN